MCCEAIIDLADAFELTVIAEGIERPDQLRRLVELGCDLGQGNALSPPLSAADADALLLNVGLLGSHPLELASAGAHAAEEAQEHFSVPLEEEPAGRDPKPTHHAGDEPTA